jgi:hypothetical protein
VTVANGWIGGCAALVLALPTVARAQDIQVEIDPDLARAAGVDPDEVEQEVRTAMAGKLKLDAPEAYLREMAAANAFATKGMGVDYATNPQRFVAGGSIGTAVNGAGFTFVHGPDALSTAGYSFQASGMAALNLGFLSKDDSFLRRFVVSVNGMWAKGKSGPFTAELYNVGGHVQVKLIRPPHTGVVEWGGLDVTGGYELASYALELTEALPVETGGLRWDATGNFDISTVSHTIPVEVSTNLRVAVVTVFGGVALDVRGDSLAHSEISIAGPLVASGNGQEQQIGTVRASVAADGTTSSLAPRAFGGVQINILPVKIYGQLNVGLEDTWGGHLGVRVAL